MLTSSTFLSVIAQTLAQKKCQHDRDMCIFYHHMAALTKPLITQALSCIEEEMSLGMRLALAGDTRLCVFFMEVEWLFDPMALEL